MDIQIACFACQTQLTFIDQVPRRAECTKCGEDVYCCKNCEFYDAKAYNECHETSAEPVREKERSNFCGFFKAHTGALKNQMSDRDKLMSAAEALFKKKP